MLVCKYGRLVLACGVFAFLGSYCPAVTLVNADFELDGGRFAVPTGWTPYGEAAFGSTWEQDWKAHVADVYPHHRVGLYQVVPDVRTGRRYRLEARCRSGHEHLSVRIGLWTAGGADGQEATWSPHCNHSDWQTLTVEHVAQANALLVMLEVENRNPDHQLLEGGAWDSVRLLEIDNAGPPQEREASVQDALAVPPPTDIYAGLANLWSLAWPKNGVRTFLAGTHDPNPEGNADFDRCEGRLVENGREWKILKSLSGPGAVVRIWMTNFDRPDRIRIEVDGRRVFEDRLINFFGHRPPFVWPLANKTSGAWVSHLPIPFRRSARVLVTKPGKDRFYWQITHQAFESSAGVRPFTLPLNPKDAAYLELIRRQWMTATLDPKPAPAGAVESSGTVSVPPAGTVKIWSADTPGTVASLFLEPPANDAGGLRSLRIRATWDDAPAPQVDAPLGLFFGVGYDSKVCRGLLAGMAPPIGGYCYFPMPYEESARIELLNTGTQGISGVRFCVRHAPLPPENISPLRFCALSRYDPRAGERRLFLPLNVNGRGHLVGLSAAMAAGSRRDAHYLEGDEYIWVDGEPAPSTAGTGTEDYFSCGWYFFSGPTSLAPVGALEVPREPRFRTSAYRLHVPDWVPFERSLKFGLEVGDRLSSEDWGRYATVSYYYLDNRERDGAARAQKEDAR